MIHQFSKTLKRLQRSRRYGLLFTRAKWFRLPAYLVVKGQKLPLRLRADTGTRNAFIDIFYDDVYRLEFIKKHSIASVVDVGGHAGLFSAYAKTMFPKAVVHAYEPNPQMADAIRTQAAVFGFSLYTEGVSDKDEKGEMNLASDSVNSSISAATEGSIRLVGIQECVTRIGGSVDLLKLDCEGYEWKIFRSTSAFENVRFITMEYHLSPAVPDIQSVKLQLAALHFQILHFAVAGPTWGQLLAVNTRFKQR